MNILTESRASRLLSSGGYAFGTWVNLVRSPDVIRMIAIAGFDFVCLDTSHSAPTTETLADMCAMARACGITPIIRPDRHEQHLAMRLLDIGAMGLMFFDVTTRRQVEDFQRWVKYPPHGLRGAAPRGTGMDYQRPSDQLMQHANDNTLVVIQIESAEGVEGVEDIVSGGGVDVVEIGRNDLSTSYGAPHQTRHPRVLEAVDHVVQACTRHHVAVMAACYSAEDGEDMVERGVRSLTYFSDVGLLMNGYEAGIQLLHGLASKVAPRIS